MLYRRFLFCRSWAEPYFGKCKRIVLLLMMMMTMMMWEGNINKLSADPINALDSGCSSNFLHEFEAVRSMRHAT